MGRARSESQPNPASGVYLKTLIADLLPRVRRPTHPLRWPQFASSLEGSSMCYWRSAASGHIAAELTLGAARLALCDLSAKFR